MRTILTVTALIMSLNSFAQQPYETTTDEKNGSTVFKGQITFDDLQKEKSFTWFEDNATAYKPKQAAVDFLKDNLTRYRIVVFMGTWCDDSQYLVPHLYKLLTLTGFPMGECNIYGVDRTKTTRDGAHTRYKIEKVPTIILIRNGKEAGRITETVQNSLEKDLMKIVEGDH